MVVRRECEACGKEDDIGLLEASSWTEASYRYCNECRVIFDELRVEAELEANDTYNKIKCVFDDRQAELIQEERGRRNRDEARGEGEEGGGDPGAFVDTRRAQAEFYRAAVEPPPESEGGAERKDTNSAGGGDRTEDPNLRQSHFPRCSSDELRPNPPREEGTGGCTC